MIQSEHRSSKLLEKESESVYFQNYLKVLFSIFNTCMLFVSEVDALFTLNKTFWFV